MRLYKGYIVTLKYTPEDYKSSGTVATLKFWKILGGTLGIWNLPRSEYKEYKGNSKKVLEKYYLKTEGKNTNTVEIKFDDNPKPKEVLQKINRRYSLLKFKSVDDKFIEGSGLSTNQRGEIVVGKQKAYISDKASPMAGLNFSEFEAWVEDLKVPPEYPFYNWEKGSRALLKGKHCVVTSNKPINQGGKLKVGLRLFTNDPTHFVRYSLYLR